MRIAHTLYLNSSKEKDIPAAIEDEEARSNYRYAGYEVALSGELDTETGNFYVHCLDDVPLTQETQV